MLNCTYMRNLVLQDNQTPSKLSGIGVHLHRTTRGTFVVRCFHIYTVLLLRSHALICTSNGLVLSVHMPALTCLSAYLHSIKTYNKNDHNRFKETELGTPFDLPFHKDAVVISDSLSIYHYTCAHMYGHRGVQPGSVAHESGNIRTGDILLAIGILYIYMNM